jgi:uncharacterized membrane protein YdjX (TVP38/TMEM64 family)
MSRAAWARVGVVVAVLALLVIGWQTGILHTLAEPTLVREKLQELGPWGWLAFVVAYTLFQPFGVPGTAFVIAASLIWPWPIAFALSMTGTMAASVVGFSFARFVARDWVAKRIPKRFRRYDEALEKRGFLTVVILRFIFWMPPLLHASLGISKVRFWSHFWGSFVGYLIPLFAMAFFGQKVFDWMKNAPIEVWLVMPVVLVVAGVIWWRRAGKLEEREARAAREAE